MVYYAGVYMFGAGHSFISYDDVSLFSFYSYRVFREFYYSCTSTTGYGTISTSPSGPSLHLVPDVTLATSGDHPTLIRTATLVFQSTVIGYALLSYSLREPDISVVSRTLLQSFMCPWVVRATVHRPSFTRTSPPVYGGKMVLPGLMGFPWSTDEVSPPRVIPSIPCPIPSGTAPVAKS